MNKNIIKRKITLTVSGIELKLITEEGEDYMKKLAHMIDRRIGDIVMNNARCNKVEAALFTCLDYLDEKLKTEKRLAEADERAERFQREFSLLKRENDELKRLLGGASADAAEVSGNTSAEASGETAPGGGKE